MIHETIPLGALQCNCYVLGDEESREAVVVDPGDRTGPIHAILTKYGLRVMAIVITHAHIDHVGGAALLKRETGAPVYMNKADQVLYDRLDMQAAWLGIVQPEQTEIDTPLRDGDVFRIAGIEISVLHTPGHTEGSSSLWIPSEQMVLSGDTLFRETIGRTDLPGGDGRKILQSIKEKLLMLPEETVVYPGHGVRTTIGHEKERNPFLAYEDV